MNGSRKLAGFRGWSRWTFFCVFGIALTSFGCSRSPRGDELTIMKKRVNATNLQAWAKQVLRDYPNQTQLHPYFPGLSIDSTMVVLSNPPVMLREMGILGRIGPSIQVSPVRPSSNRCVSLLYAESFGFGGDGHIIAAGDENYREGTNGQCVEWIPGVYYHYVHSP
jgi:hypothetical protein